MVRLRICSISYKLVGMWSRFFTIATSRLQDNCGNFPEPQRISARPVIALNNFLSQYTPPFVLAVGSDSGNDALQQQIDELKQALQDHAHSYLTGTGKAHKKVVATTGPATVPAP